MVLIRLCGKWPKAGKYQAVIWLHILQFVTGSLPISNMISRQRNYKGINIHGIIYYLHVIIIYTKLIYKAYLILIYRLSI